MENFEIGGVDQVSFLLLVKYSGKLGENEHMFVGGLQRCGLGLTFVQIDVEV